MSKLKMWDATSSWEEAEQAWNCQEEIARKKAPIKTLKTLPSMPGITKETAKGLKWKSFKWILQKDHQKKILKGFLRHPFRYAFRYFHSLIFKKEIKREGDFFLYGVDSVASFETLLKNKDHLFVVGFSYCHKPFECPSGRFTDGCVHDLKNPVCQQCFIGKAMHALPEKLAIPLIIPTIHYIGEKIFDVVHKNPHKKVLFLITACEMTLKMFSDLGNMVDIVGLGVRLDGRICNTMQAFVLSEEGIKPGLTVVLDDTKKKMLSLIRTRRT